MRISSSHKITGEIVEFDIQNLADLVNAWRIASEYEKLAKDLKDKLKPELAKYLNDDGKSDEIDGYRFTTSFIQRKNYDKAVMRQVLDEDTFDLLLIPHKTKVDQYIKENLSELGDTSTILRESMVEDGEPYSVTRLEKIT